jgi:hypothetical protein
MYPHECKLTLLLSSFPCVFSIPFKRQQCVAPLDKSTPQDHPQLLFVKTMAASRQAAAATSAKRNDENAIKGEKIFIRETERNKKLF